jgi:RNA polymerase sigma-70 factor (ECF subfamily)
MIYLRHWFKITMTAVLEAAAINSHAMTTSNAADQRQMLREFEEHTMPLMPRLLAQARALTNSEQDAQDLVQETYLKAFRAWKQFELGTNLKAWLVKIMKNTNLNNLEKSNRDKTRGSIDELEDWQVGGAESLTARASRSAEAEAMENLPTSTVLKALDTLPAEFREVVLQAIVVGLPYAEIAENMGTPVGTVMSRLHRGKKALRVALAEYAREEGYLNENELETEQE